MNRLSDIDPEVIRAAIDILSKKYRPPVVDAASVSTEHNRLELVYQSGAYRVVQDLIATLKEHGKPV